MKVIAGTTTSSPGPISLARRPRRSASSPLASPTQWSAPTHSANASSNAATEGPFVNAFVASSSATSERTSSWTAPVVTLRSTNGTSAVFNSGGLVALEDIDPASFRSRLPRQAVRVGRSVARPTRSGIPPLDALQAPRNSCSVRVSKPSKVGRHAGFAPYLRRMFALGYRSSALQTTGIWALAICSCLLVAVGIAGADGTATSLVPLVAGLAALVIALCLPAEWVFFGWLWAAPFLQDGLVDSGLGKPLQLLLYQLPPFVLLLSTLFHRGARPRGSWYDILPAASLSFIAVAILISPWVGHGGETFRALYFTVGIGMVMYYAAAFGPGRLAPDRVARVFLASGLSRPFSRWCRRRTAGARGPTTAGRRGGWSAHSRTLPSSVPSWRVLVLSSLLSLAGRPSDAATGVDCRPARRAGVALTYTRAAILAALVFGLLPGSPIEGAAGDDRNRRLRRPDRRRELGQDHDDRRVSGPFYPNRSNVEARVLIQDWSLQLAEQRPFSGWGYASFDEVKNART